MNPNTINYMLGAEINDWKIIEIRPNNRKGFVLAQCVCGKIKEVTGRSIRTQTSKNCGCKKGIKTRGRSKSLFKDGSQTALFFRYQRSAKYHDRDFTLTFDQFIKIASTNCYYCDRKPESKSKKGYVIFYYNGVDRVDNNRGYVPDNVVPCCTICNTKKGGVTISILNKVLEFLKYVKP